MSVSNVCLLAFCEYKFLLPVLCNEGISGASSDCRVNQFFIFVHFLRMLC